MYLTDGFKKDGPGHEAVTRVSLRTFFFLRNTHTQRKGKEVLIQRHIITPLKSHDNF